MGHPGIFCDIPGQLGLGTLVSYTTYSWDIPGYSMTISGHPGIFCDISGQLGLGTLVS